MTKVFFLSQNASLWNTKIKTEQLLVECCCMNLFVHFALIDFGQKWRQLRQLISFLTFVIDKLKKFSS